MPTSTSPFEVEKLPGPSVASGRPRNEAKLSPEGDVATLRPDVCPDLELTVEQRAGDLVRLSKGVVWFGVVAFEAHGAWLELRLGST